MAGPPRGRRGGAGGVVAAPRRSTLSTTA